MRFTKSLSDEVNTKQNAILILNSFYISFLLQVWVYMKVWFLYSKQSMYENSFYRTKKIKKGTHAKNNIFILSAKDL